MVKPILLAYSRQHFLAVKKDLTSVVKSVDTINSVFQRDNTRVDIPNKVLSIFNPAPTPQLAGAGNLSQSHSGFSSAAILKQGRYIDKEAERRAKERNRILSNAALETVPVFGKAPEITEKVKSKDYPGAGIVASQLALDFPNLVDDAIDAVATPAASATATTAMMTASAIERGPEAEAKATPIMTTIEMPASTGASIVSGLIWLSPNDIYISTAETVNANIADIKCFLFILYLL